VSREIPGMTASPRMLPARLLESGHVLARLVRFGMVGVASGLVYAAVTTVLVSRLGAGPVHASLMGYVLSVPVSFLGHRGFSFRSRGHLTTEARRFLFSQALNLTVAALVMDRVKALHISYLWGIVATIVLIPIANFLLMHFWVFGRGHAGADPAVP
jgi:putative flippase GtrA